MSDNSKKTCPYCHEKIQKKAKKCRYCGEWLENKKQNKTKDSTNYHAPEIRQLFWLWVATLLIFYLILYAVEFNFANDSGYWLLFLGFDILLGGTFFLALVAKLLARILTPARRKYSLYYLGTITMFILFFGILYNMPSAQQNFENNTDSNTNTIKKSPKPSKTLRPTPKPSAVNNPSAAKSNTGQNITCIGPDDKQFETTMDECKALNEKWGKPVDYMTNCNIHPDCGGGTVYMAKSECDKPCSGLPQPSSSAAPSNNASADSYKADYFCVNNVTGQTYYTTSGEKCNEDNLKASCLDVYDSIYDSCMDRCLTEASDASSYCIYNLNDSEMDECLEEKDKDHQSCMDECGAKYTKDSETCY